MKLSARKKRFFGVLGVVAIVVTLALMFFYMRIPISNDPDNYYFTNYVFVYERQPKGCGPVGLGCNIPDLFPFTRDRAVLGADPFSFKFVGRFGLASAESSTLDDIFRDKHHVIFQGEVIWDSDANDLRLFDGYAKDKNHIYVGGAALKKLDPATFELLGCGFYRDKNGVYNIYKGYENVIAMIDKDTFEVINPKGCRFEQPYNAKDKNHLYKSEGSLGFQVIK